MPVRVEDNESLGIAAAQSRGSHHNLLGQDAALVLPVQVRDVNHHRHMAAATLTHHEDGQDVIGLEVCDDDKTSLMLVVLGLRALLWRVDVVLIEKFHDVIAICMNTFNNFLDLVRKAQRGRRRKHSGLICLHFGGSNNFESNVIEKATKCNFIININVLLSPDMLPV